jgi:hypothetical protein
MERIDPTGLPFHGGDLATIFLTIDHDKAIQDLQTLSGAVGDVLNTEHGTGSRIPATEVRRLLCQAQIIPAILGTDSEVLDLGMSTRLFTKAQRRALLLKHQVCQAEGCDIPAAWCEIHHLQPWSRGGATDIGNAAALCRHHHRSIHSGDWLHTRLPDGTIRFTRRR